MEESYFSVLETPRNDWLPRFASLIAILCEVSKKKNAEYKVKKEGTKMEVVA